MLAESFTHEFRILICKVGDVFLTGKRVIKPECVNYENRSISAEFVWPALYQDGKFLLATIGGDQVCAKTKQHKGTFFEQESGCLQVNN